MKVSIIVNNFNYARYVGQSIDSALAQDHPDVEVIVVDDCSTDDSAGVIRGFGDRIVPVLKTVNAGHAAAFNSGFAASSGALVMFLDADDYLYPDAARAMAETWRPGTAMVQGLLDLVDSAGTRSGQYPGDPSVLERGDLAPTLLSRGRITTVVTSGLAFDRTVLERVMPIPEKAFAQGADGYLASVCPLYGTVRVCDRPIAAYRQHSLNHSQFAKRVVTRARWQIEHDTHRHRAIRDAAGSLGLAAAADLGGSDGQHLGARLASIRLEPAAHPVPDDHARRLARAGARSALAEAGTRWDRYSTALWFLAAGSLPIAAARPLIEWRLMPATRPEALTRLGRAAKHLVQTLRGGGAA